VKEQAVRLLGNIRKIKISDKAILAIAALFCLFIYQLDMKEQAVRLLGNIRKIKISDKAILAIAALFCLSINLI
jgi:preprotein translocase subunit Sec61beta